VVDTKQDATSTLILPAWFRYANEPGALAAIVILHGESVALDPTNAAWYRSEIAEIEAYLHRLHFPDR
jgi:hypothetical protein